MKIVNHVFSKKHYIKKTRKTKTKEKNRIPITKKNKEVSKQKSREFFF